MINLNGKVRCVGKNGKPIPLSGRDGCSLRHRRSRIVTRPEISDRSAMMTSASEITDWTGVELSRRIHARAVSAREVMQAYLARIDRLNPTFNAIVSRVDSDALLAQAGVRDDELAAGRSRGWLHGFPMALKDAVATKGIATTIGSPLLAGNIPDYDDFSSERLKAAGAIIIGKTNVPELGLGSHTYNDLFGITGNAYDPTRVAGGSSGGAAVALALRMQAVADGSDMMGSLRNPAAFNNIFGFRPSQGLVPSGPKGDQWVNQLATEGPMGRTVADLVQLLSIQAGRDDRAPLSLPGRWPNGSFDVPLDLTGVRIGWLGDLRGYLAVEPGILAVCESALARLAIDGCGVDAIAANFDPAFAWRTWLSLRRWLVAGRITQFLVDPAMRQLLKPEAQWEAEQGDGLSAADVLAASTDRTQLYHRLLALFDRYDVLALPTAQVWPFDAATHWPAEICGRKMDTYHRWMEVTIYAPLGGLPAISLPAGFNAAGLPMGLQLIGRPQSDLALLRLAREYERRAADVLAVRPPVLRDAQA
jgi:amidase